MPYSRLLLEGIQPIALISIPVFGRLLLQPDVVSQWMTGHSVCTLILGLQNSKSLCLRPGV